MTQHITQEHAIDMAVAHNIARRMKPLGLDTGDVLYCDASYRTSELQDFANAAIQHYINQQAKKLPVLPDHPEPRTMKWSALELEAIQAYGQQCAAHAREMALSEAMQLVAKLDSMITNLKGYEVITAIEALKGKR